MSSSNHEPVVPTPSGSRRAELVNLPASYAVNVDRWAVIIGVSKYKDESLNLRYADRDAEEFYKLLLSPMGGNFKSDRIKKLTNHEATTANVTKALRSFLKKPGRNDLVIIYFACHGTPDFDCPKNIYLLTHDTDPNDVSGTAIPMREIDLSLRENLLSERVIIFADTCHSAAISGGIGRRSVANETTLVNHYLKEVSTSRGGIALLTSSEANEVSFEDMKWGGGHGVFTHYLLRGMQGEADVNQNGFVTVGELFEYVRAKVQEATEYKQHPSIGNNPYDRNLPLAITFPAKNNNNKVIKSDPPSDDQSDFKEDKVLPSKKKILITFNKTSAVTLGVIFSVIIASGILTISPLTLLSGILTIFPIFPIIVETPNKPIPQVPNAEKLLKELDAVNISYSQPSHIDELVNPYSDYQKFARGCLKFLNNQRLKKKADFLVIYWNYTEELKGKVNPDSPDGSLNMKLLKDAMVSAYESNNGDSGLSFESITEPKGTPSPKADKISSLSSPDLVIRYFPQGDAMVVRAALAPLGRDVLKVGTSDKQPVPSTNAIWFGSQVSLEDVKLVAKNLLQANVPIQAIRPFRDQTAKSPLVIEIGVDRALPRNKAVLKLEDIRNATEFKR
jgi:uncharacterized caspase-like protein